MFKNYLKIALRNLIRHKGYSFINITGLAIGMACTMLILLWVQNELGFDSHHEKASQIYRVVIDFGKEGIRGAYTSPPLAAALKKDFPEVKQVARLSPWPRNLLIGFEGKTFLEKNLKYADGSIFDVFTIPFIRGNPKTALKKPNTIVITEKMANKYFGRQNPLGKSISINHPKDLYEVTGVVENYPKNSHFYFDFIGHRDWKGESWGSHCLFTYIVLPEHYKYKKLEAKFPEFVIRNMGSHIKKEYGVSIQKFLKDEKNVYKLHLQPLSDIHLNASIIDNAPTKGSYSNIYIFSLIAFFILFIACINFINLSTARSSTRTKEVGLRKVLGSDRKMLIRQFLSEAVLLSFISTLLALLIVELILPYYNQLIGRTLTVSFSGQPIFLLILFAAPFFIGLMAGFYPAFYLSSFRPITVLRNMLRPGSKRSSLRTALVVFQFTITIIIFLSTFIIFKQSRFVQNANLGFDQEQILVIHRASALENNLKTFKRELLSYPEISCVSYTDSLPGRHFDPNGHRLEGRPPSEEYTIYTMYGDPDFARLLDLKVVQGRFFSENITSDSTSAVVINEAAARKLGLENPVGKRFIKEFGNAKKGEFVTIIGVLKDFHFHSLHHEIMPMIIRNIASDWGNYISVKLSAGNINQSIKKIEKKWKTFSKGQPFVFSFLDEDFNHLYNAEIKTGKILGLFFALSIFISCLGLFGLSAFMAEQRTKEIGIRKVLGASIPGVIFLLTRDYSKWVILGNLIAWPISWFAMNKWLQNFAFRITIEWWFFILAGVLGLFISIVTVSFQSIKAATANPVEALRYE
jgi:putative ABC transport system permease protein